MPDLPDVYARTRAMRVMMVAERFGRWPWEVEALPEAEQAALLAFDQIRRSEEAREAQTLARIVAAGAGVKL